MALIVLLDANVIWSAAVRDTLLLAAEQGLFRPVWTKRILDEMASSLKLRRPDLDPVRVDRIVSQMLQFFPEGLVEGYEDLIPSMRNHEGDRHVLAAAVKAGAAVIVTGNSSHFPPGACEPYEIEVQSPDEFPCQLWYLQPAEMVSVLKQQAEHLVNPPRTAVQVVETLGRSVPKFAETVFRSKLL